MEEDKDIIKTEQSISISEDDSENTSSKQRKINS